jgi:serine phosphatase RsbU (regulator of sigma subunit)
VLRRVADETPQAIVNEIFADLDAFANGTRQFDDQTLLVLRVH